MLSSKLDELTETLLTTLPLTRGCYEFAVIDACSVIVEVAPPPTLDFVRTFLLLALRAPAADECPWVFKGAPPLLWSTRLYFFTFDCEPPGCIDSLEPG